MHIYLHAALRNVYCNSCQQVLVTRRKYDVPDIRLNCTRFLEPLCLSLQNLPLIMTLACTYDIDSVTSRCHDYVASGQTYARLEQ